MCKQTRSKRQVTWLAAIAPLLVGGASTLFAGDGAKLSTPTFILRPTAPAASEAIVRHPKKKSLRPARVTAVDATDEQTAASPATSLASTVSQPPTADVIVSDENTPPTRSSRRSAQNGERASGIIFRPVEVEPLTRATLPPTQSRTQVAIAKALAAQPPTARHVASPVSQPATRWATPQPAAVARASSAKPKKLAAATESVKAGYQEDPQVSAATTVSSNDNFAPIVSVAELPRTTGQSRFAAGEEAAVPNIDLPPLLPKSPTLWKQSANAPVEPEAANREATESEETFKESKESAENNSPAEQEAKETKEPGRFGSIFATKLRFPDLLPRSARKAEAAK